jgi:dihydrofolate reductase
VAHTINEAVQFAAERGVKEVFVIGGAEIFTTTLPNAARIYLTRIHHRFEGDVVFPEIPASEWQLVNSHTHQPDEKNAYPYTFETWERTAWPARKEP